MNASYLQLAQSLLPEVILVLTALAVIGGDLLKLRTALPLTLIGLVGAFGAAIAIGAPGPLYDRSFILDSLAFTSRLGILTLAALGLAATSPGLRGPHRAEFLALTLFATVGLTLMAVAQNLLLIFACLELASLSLYLLVGFDRSSSASNEAGLKYFFFGSLASAFLLFGFSLLFGLTHSLRLEGVALALAHLSPSPLLTLSLVMILVAFGFKAAAAPFHLWAPDAYQGAPSPAAALVASASKVAGLVLFTRLLWPGLGSAAGSLVHFTGNSWIPVVALLSGASLVIGNLAALAQSNVRRLLAYSAIAHGGVLLLGVIIAGPIGPGPLLFGAVTYGLATAGLFGVLAVLEAHGFDGSLEALAGLSRRSPALALFLGLFILSLAGVPPLAGFFGKFSIFASALRFGGPTGPLGALALLAILFSAVALYYYLRLLKAAWVTRGPSDAPPLRIAPLSYAALTILSLGLLALGLQPSWLLP